MIGYYLTDINGISVKEKYSRSALTIFFHKLRNDIDKNTLVVKFSKELNIDVDFINKNYTLKSDYSPLEAEKTIALKRFELNQNEYLKAIEYSLIAYSNYLTKSKLEITNIKTSPISNSVYLEVNNKYSFRLSDHHLPIGGRRPCNYIGEFISEKSKFIQVNKYIINTIKSNLNKTIYNYGNS